MSLPSSVPLPLARLRALLPWLLPVLGIGVTGAAVGWWRLVEDCRRDGAKVGFQDCIVGPEPALDWTGPVHRRLLWPVLSAPAWALPGDAREVREGAIFGLLAGARPEDATRLLDAARAGEIPLRLAAIHLAHAWHAEPDPLPPGARRWLSGDPLERALAILALTVRTLQGIEQFPTTLDERTPRDVHPDRYVEDAFGRPAADVARELESRLGQRATLADLQRDALLAWLTAPWDTGPHGEVLRDLCSRLFVSSEAQPWRLAARLPESSAEAYHTPEGRAALAELLRTCAPTAFDRAALSALVPVASSGWTW